MEKRLFKWALYGALFGILAITITRYLPILFDSDLVFSILFFSIGLPYFLSSRIFVLFGLTTTPYEILIIILAIILYSATFLLISYLYPKFKKK